MSQDKASNILIEKISLERVADVHDAFIESGEEWFAAGMIFKPDLSFEELKSGTENLLNSWEKDEYYMFLIVDGSTIRNI